MIYHRQVVYSLEALGYLASQPNDKYINVKELAEQLNIPRHFLGKVLTELVKRQMVVSIKGPSGGFKLAVGPDAITIYQILSKLGGLTKLEEACIMGLNHCTKNGHCALHPLWIDFKDKAISKTQKLTLKDFSQTFSMRLMEETRVSDS